MKTSMTGGEWTLSITMHGAEKFFGLSGGDVTGGIIATDPRAYSDSRVRQIFGDTKFQTWRKAHGPKRINLLSCQVGPDLENTFLQLVQHPTSKQKAVGLGEGCLLVLTRVDTTVAISGSKDIVPLKTREQYKKLEAVREIPCRQVADRAERQVRLQRRKSQGGGAARLLLRRCAGGIVAHAGSDRAVKEADPSAQPCRPTMSSSTSVTRAKSRSGRDSRRYPSRATRRSNDRAR